TAVENYSLLRREIYHLEQKIRLDFSAPRKKNIIEKLWNEIIPIGRIVRINESMLGVVVKQHRAPEIMRERDFFLVEILSDNGQIYKFLPKDYDIYSLVYPLEQLQLNKIKNSPQDITKIFNEIQLNVSLSIENQSIENSQNTENLIREKLRSNGISLHEPSEELETSLEVLEKHPCHKCEYYQDHKTKQRHLSNVKRKYDQITRRILESENLSYEAFKRMTKVLEDLRFIDKEHSLLDKGYLLATIHHENDILLAEAIFSGLIIRYMPQELVGAFAIFSMGRKDSGRFERVPKVKNRKLVKLFRKLLDYDKKIRYFETKRHVPPINITRSFSLRFVELAMLWASGKDIEDILHLTTMAAGDIINHLRRVLNLMTQSRIVIQRLVDLDMSPEIMDEAIKSLRRSHVVSLLDETSTDEYDLEKLDYFDEEKKDEYSSPIMRLRK
ncbi:MAG: hypothetical protein ACXAC7_13865, partial [Candidatus Hodarchaeales archaeon]